ncbi:MAG: hypothetical protein JSR19_02310 [Proteobacteria bacterium]|nr:hypothetical protein [Pseudomonadota bacterium]HQR03630.1 hypothetical protein [Rhodocyclaceae bacterium]
MSLRATTMSLLTLSLAALALSTPVHAARSFCCTLDNGDRSCGDILPEVCRNRAYSEFNERGNKVRSVDAPLTDAQQAARDAELKKQREADRVALEQQRRDTALLSTFATEKDLDAARDRAVAELERSVKLAQDKLDAAQKDRAKLARDAEFYKNKPLPGSLKDSMARGDAAIKSAQDGVDAKKREIDQLKAKFEADRARLRELRGDKKE